jgi:primosomal protein N' (replication factor Y) (superfamily II helicase)
MRYAEVSVNSPIARRMTFSYSIPADLSIQAGQAVWVPFGDKVLQGIVTELTAFPAVPETRDIAGIIDIRPLLSQPHLSLACWISDYYLAPLFDSIALCLPPGFERKVVTFIRKSAGLVEQLATELSPEQQQVLEVLSGKDKVPLKELEKSLGVRRTAMLISQLVARGLAARSYELERVKVKPKMVPYLRLAVANDAALEFVSGLKKSARKQLALIQFLCQTPQPVALSEVREKAGCSAATLKSLESKNIITIEQVHIEREPISYSNIRTSESLNFTRQQKSIFHTICDALSGKPSSTEKPTVFLLHGVTGSGKTEVYLQSLAHAVQMGKKGIVLVPEIALTPQTIDRFASRFPQRVAVLHSGLSLGERFDEWQRIKNGEFDVVIGSRGAIFAPQPDLGLIIIDEEHEWTYKQVEGTPRYHAREVAVRLAGLTGAVVVLGSATPDVESYFKTQTGEYRLLELPERVTPEVGSPLPAVTVVDMREELKARNVSVFSRTLTAAITRALYNKEQILLFLNRRGSASFVECRDCGFVLSCKRCEVALSYHFTGDTLLCHQCNHKTRVPLVCPQCNSKRIKYLGLGTERLEQETQGFFPQARIIRWDSDVTRGKRGSHQDIWERFRAGEADILIGTQMIAKGLDLPHVTLVGVVNADIALYIADFRSGERAFQLLSQVAGRSGRGERGGRVIVQTYSPEHYAVRAAAKHDYRTFYEKELAYRRELGNPPYKHLANLMYSIGNDNRCQQETERMKRLLMERRDSEGIAGIDFIGPAPALVHKLRGRYRWQLVLRGDDLSGFLSKVTFPRGWTVDIDPAGLS